MKREWKPGDVAIATYCGESNVRVSRYDHGWVRLDDPDDYINDGNRYESGEPRVTDARPLVVLDPETILPGYPPIALPAMLEASAQIVKESEPNREVAETRFLNAIADAFDAAIEPPKPEEPTGLSVRVFAGGSEWARVGPWWVCADLGEVPRCWEYLIECDDFRMLSEVAA